MKKEFNLNSMKNLSKAEVQNIINVASIDEVKVNDVTLTLENNSIFYNNMKAYTKTVAKKKEFNFGLGLKGIQNIIDKAIKEFYIKPFCTAGTRIDSFLSKEERLYIYDYFLNDVIEAL